MRTMPTAQRRETPRNVNAMSVEYLLGTIAVVFVATMLYFQVTGQLDLEFVGIYDWSTVNH